jgi:aminoglycoside phosphotransferase family enzyme/predicted kinase
MSLAELRAALSDPAVYPDGGTSVELRETHISLVFLTEHHAYKIKKPVNLGFVDYSTRARRWEMCERELDLNRRLSKDVYLGVQAIVKVGSDYCVGGQGRVIDHAVKMRRLPDDRTLETLLDRGLRVPVELLATQLAKFHERHALSPALQEFASLESIRRDWAENFKQTAEWIGDWLKDRDNQKIRHAIESFLHRRANWFEQRRVDRRIRDCHGDLRAEHVYWIDRQFQIIDCIEFNRRFRFIDVCSEVAFLCMDLVNRGQHRAADQFLNAYIAESLDLTLYRLLDFYLCYRAYVRAKVCGFELSNASGIDTDAVKSTAADYMALASHWSARLMRPKIILMTGLIGSGKSTLARGLAAALDVTRYSSDHLRKQRAGLDLDERQKVGFGQGIYSETGNQNTYAALFDLARESLSKGDSVLLDAAYPLRRERARIARLAAQQGADFHIVACGAPETLIRQRLLDREQRGDVVSDGRWALFGAFKRRYQPVDHQSDAGAIAVDTSTTVQQSLLQALARIHHFEPLETETPDLVEGINPERQVSC